MAERRSYSRKPVVSWRVCCPTHDRAEILSILTLCVKLLAATKLPLIHVSYVLHIILSEYIPCL